MVTQPQNKTMTKKYILKPGKHQFAPQSPAVHHNNNLTDDEAQWYLETYPHISSLFDSIPGSAQTNNNKVDTEDVQPDNQLPGVQIADETLKS